MFPKTSPFLPQKDFHNCVIFTHTHAIIIAVT